jgi:glycine hydroxymethyltransferase
VHFLFVFLFVIYLFFFVEAVAVALKDACDESFKLYTQQVISNSRALCQGLIQRGYKVVTGKFF